MEFLILVILLCLLAIASVSKGTESRDALDPSEWERRLVRGSFL